MSSTNIFFPVIALLTLEYYPKGQGEHYVSVAIENKLLSQILQKIQQTENSISNDDPYNSDAPAEEY